MSFLQEPGDCGREVGKPESEIAPRKSLLFTLPCRFLENQLVQQPPQEQVASEIMPNSNEDLVK